MKETKKPQCPECSSFHLYYRVKDGTFLCRTCGNVWKRKGEKP